MAARRHLLPAAVILVHPHARCKSSRQAVELLIRLAIKPLSHQALLSLHLSVQPSSCQAVKPSSHQAIELSSCQAVKLSSRQMVEPSSHQAVQPLSQQDVKPRQAVGLLRPVDPLSH
jgi:hypothetical protein